jgi:uncharacterized protein YdgA (DUF945 family)
MSRGPSPWNKALIGLVVGLALLLTGLPWVLGGYAQQAYEDQMAELLAALPPGSVLTEHYERGWFRSRAELDLALDHRFDSLNGVPLRLHIESLIEQGPLHWFHSGLPPSLARIRSRIRPEGNPGTLPPFLVTTDLKIDGGTQSRFHLSGGEIQGAHAAYRLRHGALTGSVGFERTDHRLTLDLDVQTLALTAPASAVATLTGLHLTAELRSAPQRDKGGSAESNEQTKADPSGAVPGRLSGGGGATGPEASRYPMPGPVDLHLDLSVEDLTLGDEPYRNIQLGLAGERVDAAAIGDLATTLQTLSSRTLPRAMRNLMTAALLARVLPRITAAEPRIAINPVRMDTPEGPLTGRFELLVEPRDDTAGTTGRRDSTKVGAWVAALRADGEIDMPESLARRWLAGTGLGGSPAPGAGAQAPSPLDAWLGDGWISLRDGRVASAIHLADGLLTVNGKTLPLLSLGGARLH